MVHSDDELVAFLDTSPLRPGHVLVVPRTHHATLDDLPGPLTGPLFELVRKVSVAVQAALPADGSFVAVNTRISQSVPHLHVHVVPRRRGDRLFSDNLVWRRLRYRDDAQMMQTAATIRAALA